MFWMMVELELMLESKGWSSAYPPAGEAVAGPPSAAFKFVFAVSVLLMAPVFLLGDWSLAIWVFGLGAGTVGQFTPKKQVTPCQNEAKLAWAESKNPACVICGMDE